MPSYVGRYVETVNSDTLDTIIDALQARLDFKEWYFVDYVVGSDDGNGYNQVTFTIQNTESPSTYEYTCNTASPRQLRELLRLADPKYKEKKLTKDLSLVPFKYTS